MFRCRWAALVALATAPQLVFAAQAVSRNERANRCYAVTVEAADSNSSRRQRGVAFSAGEVDDLLLKVWVEEKKASAPVLVKLYTPRGVLYQVLEARADGSKGRPGRASRKRIRALSARLAVAGTHITTYALFGEWRAEAYLEGSETPCARPLEFVIEP